MAWVVVAAGPWNLHGVREPLAWAAEAQFSWTMVEAVVRPFLAVVEGEQAFPRPWVALAVEEEACCCCFWYCWCFRYYPPTCSDDEVVERTTWCLEWKIQLTHPRLPQSPFAGSFVLQPVKQCLLLLLAVATCALATCELGQTWPRLLQRYQTILVAVIPGCRRIQSSDLREIAIDTFQAPTSRLSFLDTDYQS